jgi:putative ABC transport system permease protein
LKAESHGGETLSANERPVLTPIAAQLTASIRPSLLLLSGAVFFVLLVVCANLATLVLVRTSDRRNEFAVRAALGAQRGSLMRQQLVESGLLALVGGSAGVLVAHEALAALYHFRPVALAQFPPPTIETGVLIFTTALAMATGLLFGIGPAWMAGHQDPDEVLKTRGRSGTPSHNRLRRLLVSGEIAVAFVLLVGAMLLVRTIHKLNQVPLGFEIQNRLTFTVALHGGMYKKDGNMGLFYENALERLAHLPGVTGAAAISNLPLDRRPDMYLSVSGKDPNFLLYAAPRVASSGYFGTMGMPLVRGLDFSTQDRRARTGLWL